MPERFECTTLAKKRYINTLPFLFFFFFQSLRCRSDVLTVLCMTCVKKSNERQCLNCRWFGGRSPMFAKPQTNCSTVVYVPERSCLVTFAMSSRVSDNYIADDAKCILVTRVCPSPHAHTTALYPDVTWGNGTACPLVMLY